MGVRVSSTVHTVVVKPHLGIGNKYLGRKLGITASHVPSFTPLRLTHYLDYAPGTWEYSGAMELESRQGIYDLACIDSLASHQNATFSNLWRLVS